MLITVAIQVLRNAVGSGRVSDFHEKKRYEGVRFNVITIARGWVGVEFPEKNRYVTLDWPIIATIINNTHHPHTSLNTRLLLLTTTLFRATLGCSNMIPSWKTENGF